MNGSPHLHNHLQHWRIYSFALIIVAIFVIFDPWIPMPAINPFWLKMKA